jgi:hypothetical protein
MSEFTPGTDEDIEHLEFRVRTAAKVLADVDVQDQLAFMANLMWLKQNHENLEISRMLRHRIREEEARFPK